MLEREWPRNYFTESSCGPNFECDGNMVWPLSHDNKKLVGQSNNRRFEGLGAEEQFSFMYYWTPFLHNNKLDVSCFSP